MCFEARQTKINKIIFLIIFKKLPELNCRAKHHPHCSLKNKNVKRILFKRNNSFSNDFHD